MAELDTSVLLTILGAFLGSIISPACDLGFAKLFGKSGESYSIGNGLTLLSAANAAWVVSFILYDRSDESNISLWAVLLLYVIAALLLIGSFSQFKGSGKEASLGKFVPVACLLVLGNLFWLIGESTEIIHELMGFKNWSHAWSKYVLFTLAAILFLVGVFKSHGKDSVS